MLGLFLVLVAVLAGLVLLAQGHIGDFPGGSWKPVIFVLGLGFWGWCAFEAAFVAEAKGRPPVVGLLIGALTGLVGLTLLALLEPEDGEAPSDSTEPHPPV